MMQIPLEKRFTARPEINKLARSLKEAKMGDFFGKPGKNEKML